MHKRDLYKRQVSRAEKSGFQSGLTATVVIVAIVFAGWLLAKERTVLIRGCVIDGGTPSYTWRVSPLEFPAAINCTFW